MKVSDLTIQKKNRDRYNLFVEGKFHVGVSANIVAKFGLYKGRDIDEDELRLLSESAIYERFYSRTASYLERGLSSEYQVRQYIRKVYYQKKDEWIGKDVQFELPPMEDKIVEELLKYKIVDDRLFAEAFVRDRTKLRPRGKVVLIQELRGKGIDRELASEVVNELVRDESQLIKAALMKRYKVEQISRNDRKKIDFLRRRGFNWDQISQLLSD